MNLTPWKKQSCSPVKSVFDDEFFSFPLLSEWNNSLLGYSSGAFPSVDVVEEKDRFVVQADLPGLEKKNISVQVEHGILTLSGERKSSSENKEGGFHRIERSFGRFSRSISLGRDIDETQVKANYKDGVLHITIPKSKSAVSKMIPIE